MIIIKRKIYGTIGMGCGHFRFVKVKNYMNNTALWQSVKKMFWVFWIKSNHPFRDDIDMFYEISGK